jgi:Flp pilus assembly protein TadD
MATIETNDNAGKIAAILAKFGARTPREALGISEQDFVRMGQLGAMYYNQGDLGRAAIVFQGLVEVDPQSSAAHAALGALYTRTGQDEQALSHLSSASELDAV